MVQRRRGGCLFGHLCRLFLSRVCSHTRLLSAPSTRYLRTSARPARAFLCRTWHNRDRSLVGVITEFLSCAIRGILEGLKLVPSLFWTCMLGQTPSLHHSLPTEMNSLHALNMSLISENTAVQSLKNSLQVMPLVREPNPEFLLKSILPYTVSPLDFLDIFHLSVS